MAIFTDADVEKLLSQPGFFYFRDYGSSGAWTKFLFANGSSYKPAVESTEISFDDVGVVSEQVAKETAEITISSGRVLDFDNLPMLTGGLWTKSTVAGTPVAGASQVVAVGWVYDGVILHEHQNHDLGAISITSVTGSVDGVLVAGTDYEVALLPEVGYGILIKDSATVTTENQTMTIVYGYTPPVQTVLKRGGIKTIAPIEIAFQTTNSDGDFVQYIFHKCYSNGADGHGFGSANSAEPITMDIAFTAKEDKNRTAGDTLMQKILGGTTLG